MAVTTSPTYPVYGSETTLSATGTGTAFEYVITAVPTRSSLELGLIVDSAGVATDVFTPDVPGDYAITVYEYQQYTGIPRFPLDPGGVARNVLVATQTTTIEVGTYADLSIRTKDGHNAVLRLNIAGSTVRAASIADTQTDLTRIAALDSTITTNLAALVGVTVANLSDSLETKSEDLRANYEYHRANTDSGAASRLIHANDAGTGIPDAVNVVTAYPANSNASAVVMLNDILAKFSAHIAIESDSATKWHEVADSVNVPIVPAASSLEEATVLAADLRRCYEAHRVTTTAPVSLGTPEDEVHQIVDSYNALTAAKPLDTFLVSWLQYLASEAPTLPNTEVSGLLTAIAKLGMIENLV